LKKSYVNRSNTEDIFPDRSVLFPLAFNFATTLVYNEKQAKDNANQCTDTDRNSITVADLACAFVATVTFNADAAKSTFCTKCTTFGYIVGREMSFSFNLNAKTICWVHARRKDVLLLGPWHAPPTLQGLHTTPTNVTFAECADWARLAFPIVFMWRGIVKELIIVVAIFFDLMSWFATTCASESTRSSV
jgi:hypothetical protein